MLPSDVDAHDILNRMAVDKKNKGGLKYMVYLRCIGDAGKGAEAVEDDTLLRILSPSAKILPSGLVFGQ